MATLWRIGKACLKIHAADHNPPHGHIYESGMNIRFDLRTFQIFDPLKQPPSPHVAQLLVLARDNPDRCWETWHRLNDPLP